MDHEVLYIWLSQLAMELQVQLSAIIGRFSRVHPQFGHGIDGECATESDKSTGSIMLRVAKAKLDVITRAIIRGSYVGSPRVVQYQL